MAINDETHAGSGAKQVDWCQPRSEAELLFRVIPGIDAASAQEFSAELELAIAQTLSAAAEKGTGIDPVTVTLCNFAMDAVVALRCATDIAEQS